jgi:hypothetical protein
MNTLSQTVISGLENTVWDGTHVLFRGSSSHTNTI